MIGEGAQQRPSVALGSKMHAHHPLTQQSVAEAATELDAIAAAKHQI